MAKFTEYASQNKKPYQYIPIPIIDKEEDEDDEICLETVKIIPENPSVKIDIPEILKVEVENDIVCEKEEFSDLELSSLELLEIKKHALNILILKRGMED